MVQVKEQVQEFKERQAIVTHAESLAASYGSREAALAAREQKVASQEDTSQRAAAAAEYARNEAEAMWQKQKVCPCTTCSMVVVQTGICSTVSVAWQLSAGISARLRFYL